MEELTEDSDEIKEASAWQQEIYRIKKEIKVTFKRDNRAPDTCTWFYKFGKLVGRGAFGKVNLALHKLSRKIVAVKSINKQILNKKVGQAIDVVEKKVKHEEEVWSKLRHKNVVKFFEKLETESHHLFFMELCQGGDLLNFVRKRRRLEEPLAKYLFKQIVIGLGYIHS